MKAEILKATTIRGKFVDAGTVQEVENSDFVILRMQKQAVLASTETANAKPASKGKQGT